MRARTPVSSTTTTRAPQTPSQLSVSCTNWPPGAMSDPGRWPEQYSAGSRTSMT